MTTLTDMLVMRKQLSFTDINPQGCVNFYKHLAIEKYERIYRGFLRNPNEQNLKEVQEMEEILRGKILGMTEKEVKVIKKEVKKYHQRKLRDEETERRREERRKEKRQQKIAN